MSDDLMTKVQDLIENMINPAVAGHGGFVQLVDVKDNKVYLQMGGGCQGCGAADVTLKQGIERLIKEEIPEIEEGVDRMKTDAGDAPLIAVGGGSFLVPPRLAGISDVLNVPHQAVANAVGAAIAQVSGEVDQIFQDLTRDEAIARARGAAEDKAVAAGADRASINVVEVEDLPLAYLPGNSLRTRVRVVGDIAG